MERKHLWLIVCLLQIGILFACAGISGSSEEQPPPGVTLRAITVAPTSPGVNVGATQQLSASGSYSDGSQQDITQSVTWASTNSGVATVNPSGLMTGVAAGSTTITATSGAVNGTVTATVSPATQQSSGVHVLTWHNDNARTGANTQESTLTPANVNSESFGKLFHFQVEGDVQAQPLYVSNLTINGKARNVLFVAAQKDVVYAFDADGDPREPLWTRSFVDPANGTVVPQAPGDTGGSPCCPANPGITGTPVIDVNSSTMYLVARTKENGKQIQRLHALDILTGAIKKSAVINPSVSGTGDKNFLSTPGSSATTVVFNNATESQRPGLLLANGNVFVTYGAHSDAHPYHGWVLGYNANSLDPVVVWNATPNGQGGGIWMSGGAPAADSTGNMYFSTGNGDFDPGKGNYSQAWIKMSGDGQVLSYFAPYNWDALNRPDMDVGGAGPSLILPDQSGANPHLLVSVDKNGPIFLLDRDNMGGFHEGDNSNVIQTICDAFPGRTDCASIREEKDPHVVRSS
ncbi:MAG: Ig-like domain-containing protein, partial [Candidatus Korobacteraceae bacterium]